MGNGVVIWNLLGTMWNGEDQEFEEGRMVPTGPCAQTLDERPGAFLVLGSKHEQTWLVL